MPSKNGTCTWGTWHVVTHVEETHTESKKQGSALGAELNERRARVHLMKMDTTSCKRESRNYSLFFYRQF